MKYYLVVGEASGDMHAANLIKELCISDKEAHFQGFGGDKMQAQGLQLVKHYKEMAFMGFLEVIVNGILRANILGFALVGEVSDPWKARACKP